MSAVVPETVGETAVAQAPRWARWFVRVFLSAVVLAGVFGVEAWPLTGWRLFADLRRPEQSSVRAYIVEPGGAERLVPFARLPAPYSGSTQVLNGLVRLAPDEREAVCAAWADAAREIGLGVAGIRVYRLAWDASVRGGPRAAPPAERTILFACAGGER